ncbi:MAG: LemA family protein [Thermoplasmata archaeon]|nr:LemA family protein [Thermoplasmata archaeon]
MEVQVERKLNLIPSLVETAEAFADFERSLLENITALRSQFLTGGSISQQINTTEQIDQLLFDFKAVYENYPILETGPLFASLMDELAGSENRIAVEQRRYNDAVRAYNTAIRVFPNNLVAAMFGFQDAELYEPISGGA